MGKYDLNYCGDTKSTQYWMCQLAIANELAESNRLKRMELDCEYGKEHWKKTDRGDGLMVTVAVIDKEELEDQAL